MTPDTRGIGLLEFHQIDRAREAGRLAGAAVVEALEQLHPRTIVLPEQRSVVDLDAAHRHRQPTRR